MPVPRAASPAASSSWSAGSATSQPPARPLRSSSSGDRVVPRAGIALTGVGGRHHRRPGGGRTLVGQPLDGGRHRRRAADLAARGRAADARPPGQRGVQGHIIHTFVTRILTRAPRSRQPHEQPVRRIPQAPAEGVPVHRVTISVNGQPRTADVEPRSLLAHPCARASS